MPANQEAKPMALTPRHCTIIAVDIEKYSERPEPVQASLRTALYQATRDALTATNVVWAECDVLERGDSLIVLVPPTVTPVDLVTVFIGRLTGELRQHAAIRSTLARMRLRAALHAGYVSPDEHGHVGDAINETARLLDAEALRRVLAATDEAHLAVIVSDDLYRAVVGNGHGGADPEEYAPVTVSVKAYRAAAWLRVPGLTGARVAAVAG